MAYFDDIPRTQNRPRANTLTGGHFADIPRLGEHPRKLEAEVALHRATTTLPGRVGADVQRGFARGLNALTGMQLGESLIEAQLLDDPEIQSVIREQQFQDPALLEATGGIEGLIEHERRDELANVTELARTIGEREASIAHLPTRPVVGAIAEAPSVAEAFERFKVDPLGAVGGVSVESGVQMLPALAVGALNVPAGVAALGLTSAGLEQGSTILEVFHEAGVDPGDPAQVLALLEDPARADALIQEGVKKGATRAAIIGTLDAATAGLASKMLVPSALGGPLTREALNVPVQLGTQATAGAGGEALAQVATEGSVTRPGEAFLEAVGEAGTAVPEVATLGRPLARAARGRADARSQEDAAREEALRVLSERLAEALGVGDLGRQPPPAGRGGPQGPTGVGGGGAPRLPPGAPRSLPTPPGPSLFVGQEGQAGTDIDAAQAAGREASRAELLGQLEAVRGRSVEPPRALPAPAPRGERAIPMTAEGVAVLPGQEEELGFGPDIRRAARRQAEREQRPEAPQAVSPIPAEPPEPEIDAGARVEPSRPESEAASPSPRPDPRRGAARRAARVDPDRDDLLTAIAKLGGISRAEAEASGIDPAEFQRRAGIRYVMQQAFEEQQLAIEAEQQLTPEPADDPAPEAILEEDSFSPEMDEGGRRLLALSADLERLAPGAAERILAEAEEQFLSTDATIDQLEEAIRERTSQAGEEATGGAQGAGRPALQGRQAPAGEEPVQEGRGRAEAPAQGRGEAGRRGARLDLFGADTSAAQALADRERDVEARLGRGREQPPIDEPPGTLLGPPGQRDITDVTRTDIALDSDRTEEPRYRFDEREASTLREPQGDQARAPNQARASGEQLELFGAEPIERGRAQEALRTATTVARVRTGTFRHSGAPVRTAQDAAHVVAPLRKEAQENLVALVLDENQQPIEVIRHTIGERNAAQVDNGVLIGAIHSVPGAREVWVAHNHPSGDPGQSEADRIVTTKLARTMQDLGIVFNGMLVVAPGGRASVFTVGAASSLDIEPAPGRRRAETPQTERRIRRSGKLGEALTGPASAIDKIPALARGRSGVALLDTRHAPVAFLPMTADEMNKLRAGRGAGGSRLASAIHESNAKTMIVYLPEAMSSIATNDLISNVASFGRALGTDVLDAIVNGKSMASGITGLPKPLEAFRRRSDQRGRQSLDERGEAVRAAVEDLTGRWANGPSVRVVATEAELPVEPTGDTAGLWTNEGPRGTIYVVAEHVDDAADAVRTVLHEAVGHGGLRAVMGEAFNPFLDDVAKTFRADVARQAERYGLDMDDPKERREAAEEFLAHLAEEDSPRHQSLLDRVLVRLARALRRLLPNFKLTRAEVREVLARARGFVERRREGGARADQELETVRGDGRTGPRQEARRSRAQQDPAVGGRAVPRGDEQGRPEQVREASAATTIGPERFTPDQVEGFGETIEEGRGDQVVDVTSELEKKPPGISRRRRRNAAARPGETLREAYQRRIGRPAWDALAAFAKEYLSRVKLANNAPAAFKQMVREYRAEVLRAGRTIEGAADVLSQLSPAERELVSDYIDREMRAGMTPPAHIVEIARTLIATTEAQSEELVSLGMLAEESREFYRGRYLARFYAKHVDGNPLNRFLRRRFQRIDGSRLKARGLFEFIPEEHQAEYEELGWVQRGEGRREGEVLMWRDWTREDRERWGEIRDAGYRFVRGYMEAAKDVAMARLFKAMADDPNVSSEEQTQRFSRQVPSDFIGGLGPKNKFARAAVERQGGFAGIRKFGALAGRWVEPSVMDELEHHQGPNNALVGMYLKALSLWKEGKTSLNPVVHSNNVISNVVMADLADVPLRYYNAARREYLSKGPRYQEAQNHGLFGTEFYGTEIKAMLPAFDEFRSAEDVAVGLASRVVRRLAVVTGARKYRQVMGRLYQAEDQYFKLMTYMHRRDQGLSISEAIDEAERYFFNYADLPKGARYIRNTVLPFFSYTFKAAPALLHVAMVRPWKFAKWGAFFAGLNWAAFAYLYGDDAEEQEADERAVMDDYMQGMTAIAVPFTELGVPKSMRLSLNDANGEVAYLDLSRRMPLGDLFDMQNQMGGIPLPQPLVPNNPVLTLAAGLLYNVDSFSGRDIVSDADTDWEKTGKWARWTAAQLMPNTPLLPGSYSWSKVMNGIAAEVGEPIDAGPLGEFTGKDFLGREQSLPRALGATVTGFKVRTFDVERNRQKRIRRLAGLINDVRGDIRFDERSRRAGAITDKTADKRRQDNLAKIEKLKADIAELRQ